MEDDLFGEPPTRIGQLWSGVISNAQHFETMDPGLCAAFVEPWHHSVLILHDSQIPSSATLYGWQVIDDDPIVLGKLSSSQMYSNDRSPVRFSSKVVELCAGSGAMGLGAAFLGAQITVAIEMNSFAAEHLRKNDHGVVLEGNVASPYVLASAHRALDGATATGLAGFPCQPFSCQGLGKGENDYRFEGFTGTIKATWLLQCQALVLECVPGAQSNPAVRKALDLLCRAMNWCLKECIIDLKTQWPMRRQRWWCILGPRLWLEQEIPDWGMDPCFQKVGHLFPAWPTWPIEDEEILQVTEEEMLIFGDVKYGKDLRLLCSTDVAPTLLHSYGSLLSACPCKCRSTPFSAKALETKGARGYYVTSTLNGLPRLLHPVEAASLLGIPTSMKFHYNARDSLALLGQVASPLPMIWVFTHLVNSAAQHVPALHVLDPKQTLHAFKHELLRQLHEAQHLPMQTNIISLSSNHGEPFHIMAAGTSLASQLLQAERINLDFHEDLMIMRQGKPVTLTERFAEGQEVGMELQVTQKNGMTPTETILIAIQAGEQLYMEYLNPGQFLFQALPDELKEIFYFADAVGRIFCKDTRIWRTTRLVALSDSAFPTLCKRVGPINLHDEMQVDAVLPVSSTMGGGASEVDGLTAHTLWMTLQTFVEAHYANGLQPCHVPPNLVSQLQNGILTKQVDLLRAGFDGSDGTILCPFVAQKHWALLFGRLHDGHLHWTYFDGLDHHLRDHAKLLASSLCDLLEVPMGSLHDERLYNRQVDDFRCGTIALAHALWACGFCGHFTTNQIAHLHRFLLEGQGSTSKDLQAFGPGAPDLQRQVGILLGEKGVFAQDARATALIEKIGAGKIAAALKANNPWATLKELASKPGVNFRIVSKEELNAQIASRASNRYGATIPNHKAKKTRTGPSKLSSTDLDPTLLQIDPDHFQDADNDKVAQISFDAVRAEARGLAICSISQAIPFLRAGKSISADALGLLTLSPVPEELAKSLPTAAIRFPASYGPTAEPLLVSGALIQLGDVQIHRHLETCKFQAELAEVSVLKIVVIRDEFQLDWHEFVSSPVKMLMNIMPMLQLCRGRQCGSTCVHFHAPVGEEYDSAVQEIWGRRFTNLEGKQVASKDAEIFQVFFRAIAAAADVAATAKIQGIYIEPRVNDNLGMDPRYAVVWLANVDLAMARHTFKTFSDGHALVRVKNRFGIRVKTQDEESAHKALRPDHPYLKIKISKVFKITPLPHGVQRASLIKILSSWGWEAKPLQPTRGSSLGSAWEVGSSTPPPKTIMRAFDQDVIISEVRERSSMPEAPTVVASAKLHGALRGGDRARTEGKHGKHDPWTQPEFDPWANFTPTMGASSHQGSGTKKHIEEVEARLQAKVQDAVKQHLQDHQGDVQMAEETSLLAYQQNNEERFKKLEVGVHEIQVQQQQFHQWSTKAGQQMANQEQQIVTLQNTTAEMSAGLHNSVQNMGSELMSSMESNFTQRFNQLEALLSKKTRTE